MMLSNLLLIIKAYKAKISLMFKLTMLVLLLLIIYALILDMLTMIKDPSIYIKEGTMEIKTDMKNAMYTYILKSSGIVFWCFLSAIITLLSLYRNNKLFNIIFYSYILMFFLYISYSIYIWSFIGFDK